LTKESTCLKDSLVTHARRFAELAELAEAENASMVEVEHCSAHRVLDV